MKIESKELCALSVQYFFFCRSSRSLCKRLIIKMGRFSSFFLFQYYVTSIKWKFHLLYTTTIQIAARLICVIREFRRAFFQAFFVPFFSLRCLLQSQSFIFHPSTSLPPFSFHFHIFPVWSQMENLSCSFCALSTKWKMLKIWLQSVMLSSIKMTMRPPPLSPL